MKTTKPRQLAEVLRNVLFRK